jgi:hypothetical protein
VNGSDAIFMDSKCNITVEKPTQIRFIFRSASGVAYHPSGISFIGDGGTDPTGIVEFSTRDIGYDALVIRANDVNHGSTYRYHLYFQDDRGTEYVMADGIPRIHPN